MLQEKTKKWLFEDAFPFWLEKGVHEPSGGFVESVSLDGEAQLSMPRRAMIQGRQLYVLRTAENLGATPKDRIRARIQSGTESLARDYALPSGAFVHAVDEKGKPAELHSDLYGQSFVLFGLANSFAVIKDEKIRAQATSLLDFLNRERKLAAGGYSEIEGGQICYRSNPHMHLFEAALAWMAVDTDPRWRALADAIYSLATTKFIDEKTGLLAEYFTSSWSPLLENGRFIAEPGHHYEWAWLFLVYGKLTGLDTRAHAKSLFDLAEKHGICGARGVVFDEIWSDFSPKKRTSRYWPQCERVKAAVRLGEFAVADDALATLFLFLKTPVKGLCFDFQEESGAFSQQAPRASFLYHVVNAMDEYLAYREAKS